MDNKTAVFYVRRQGGTRSLHLLQVASEIFEFAKSHLLDLSVASLEGSEHLGRLPELQLQQHGVDAEPKISRRDLRSMGDTRGGPYGNSRQLSGSPFLLPVLPSTGYSTRSSLPEMEF